MLNLTECFLSGVELLDACKLDPSFLRVAARDEKRKQVESHGKRTALLLYSEQLRAHTEITKEMVTIEEKSAIKDWAEGAMLIRSGTSVLTFRLAEAKGHLIDSFGAAYPRILRGLLRAHPTLRATSTQALTIFHRNVEHAFWLAKCDGFVEGDAADEGQKKRFMIWRDEGAGRARVEKITTLADFDPATWTIISRCMRAPR
jgi:hypothetical protein